MTAGLIRQGTTQIDLTAAGRAGDEDVVVLMDPVTAEQAPPPPSGAVDPAPA
ncbi:hypothetical protein [Marinobacter sp.]|uniref:hypothetical protein n=1 Tax=Marinobacter sp. TaxID=50741 RepID=UPI0025C4952F|nr:hypothetical protein [Marinobacter sp.]